MYLNNTEVKIDIPDQFHIWNRYYRVIPEIEYYQT